MFEPNTDALRTSLYVVWRGRREGAGDMGAATLVISFTISSSCHIAQARIPLS